MRLGISSSSPSPRPPRAAASLTRSRSSVPPYLPLGARKVDPTSRTAVEKALAGARGLFLCGSGPAGEGSSGDVRREALEGAVAADAASA